MKKITLLALALFASIALFAQTEETHYVEVRGMATTEIAPDRIFLKITINEKDYKNKSLPEIERGMMEKLKALGIDTKENLTITDLASNFKHYFLVGNDAKVMKQYELLTSDAKVAGKVIVELGSMGISQISVSKVENSKEKEHKNEVMKKAILNAKEKAELLVGAVGGELGRVITITESYFRSSANDGNIRITGLSAKASGEESYQSPDVDFEKIELEYSVSARWEILK